MSSELKVDTVSEKTTDNGIAVDSFKLKDGLMVNSSTIAVHKQLLLVKML